MKGSPRILVVRQDKLGDCLLATSLLASLRAAHPEAFIRVVCQPGMAMIFERANLDLDIEVGPYRPPILGWVSLGLRWRKDRFDAAIIPKECSGDYSMAAWLAGIPKRIGSTPKLNGIFLTTNFWGRLDPSLHEVRIMLRMAEEALGGILPELPLSFHPTPEERERANRLAEGLGDTWVLCPFTGGTSAPWPLENFVKLGERASGHGMTALVAGGPDQAEEAERAAVFPGGVSIAGHGGLGEFAVLFGRSRALVSVNSGLIHLAASQGVPVVVIETRDDHATASRRWSPWMTRHVVLSPTSGAVGVEEASQALDRILRETDEA
jgi:ADP-heptose:LPS heptosyltransferase